MLLKIAVLLLALWVVGLTGIVPVGDAIHACLLGGLLLLLLAFARARDVDARAGRDHQEER